MSNVLSSKSDVNNISKLQFSSQFKSLIALVILLSAGFIDELVGCSALKILTKNMYVKHFILILVIYVSIDLNKNDKVSPLDNFKDVFLLYGFYLMLIRLDRRFTIFVAGLLLITYLVNNYNKYYQLNDMDKENKMTTTALKYLEKGIIGIVVIGYVVYFMKQYREQPNFNIFKFIFGKLECKNTKIFKNKTISS